MCLSDRSYAADIGMLVEQDAAATVNLDVDKSGQQEHATQVANVKSVPGKLILRADFLNLAIMNDDSKSFAKSVSGQYSAIPESESRHFD
jgi:hypothetical protein